MDPQTYETIAPLRLSHALTYALKAVIAGTGNRPKPDSTLRDLFDTLHRLAPEEDLTTEISFQQYDHPSILQSTSIQHLVEASTRDIQKFRKLATRLRTRTTKRANISTKAPELPLRPPGNPEKE